MKIPNSIKLILAGLLIGVASWQAYNLINMSGTMLLAKFGIVNPLWQGLIILAVILAVLIFILKMGFGKALKGILRIK